MSQEKGGEQRVMGGARHKMSVHIDGCYCKTFPKQTPKIIKQQEIWCKPFPY